MSLETQSFENFDEWVNWAHIWLVDHPDFNDTEHGGDGFRGHHFKAICFDSQGRICRQGSDFMRARDEGAFPVQWLWPDQIGPLFLAAHAAVMDEPTFDADQEAIVKMHGPLRDFGFSWCGWEKPTFSLEETFK